MPATLSSLTLSPPPSLLLLILIRVFLSTLLRLFTLSARDPPPPPLLSLLPPLTALLSLSPSFLPHLVSAKEGEEGRVEEQRKHLLHACYLTFLFRLDLWPSKCETSKSLILYTVLLLSTPCRFSRWRGVLTMTRLWVVAILHVPLSCRLFPFSLSVARGSILHTYFALYFSSIFLFLACFLLLFILTHRICAAKPP